MTTKKFIEILKDGEGIEIEFKASQHRLNKNTFETVCAFLNRKGGHLLLGVENDSAVEGVFEDSLQNIVTNIVTNANNPQKLNPPFYLSPRVIEYNDNSLIHREYANAFPAKFVIEKERVLTENWNRPHGGGVIDPDNFSPYPKNPVIAKFFKELGRVDELGSGVRNTFKYCGIYVEGTKPMFIEDDVFKTVIPLKTNENKMVPAENGEEVGRKWGGSGEKMSKNQKLILEAIAGNSHITIGELSDQLGIGTTTVENNIKKLKKKDLLERVGPAKGGYWRIKN